MIVMTLRQDDNTSIIYSEEFMFEFTKWCAKNYYRFTKFWRKLNSTEMGCYTTKELLEQFKKLKDETNRQT